jgi:hypothetical protein
MEYQGQYVKKQQHYAQYAAIKRLVDEYFKPEENKKYEEFIKKLVMILEL